MQKTLKKTLISDRKIWDCYHKKISKWNKALSKDPIALYVVKLLKFPNKVPLIDICLKLNITIYKYI